MLKLHPFKLPLLFAIVMLMLCMQITTSQAARMYNKSGVTLYVLPYAFYNEDSTEEMLTIKAGERSKSIQWNTTTMITLCSEIKYQPEQIGFVGGGVSGSADATVEIPARTMCTGGIRCDTWPKSDLQGGNYGVWDGNKLLWNIDGVEWTCKSNNNWSK